MECSPLFHYSEASPLTDELVCFHQIYRLKHRDAGCWILDAGKSNSFLNPSSIQRPGSSIFVLFAPQYIETLAQTDHQFRMLKKSGLE